MRATGGGVGVGPVGMRGGGGQTATHTHKHKHTNTNTNTNTNTHCAHRQTNAQHKQPDDRKLRPWKQWALAHATHTKLRTTRHRPRCPRKANAHRNPTTIARTCPGYNPRNPPARRTGLRKQQSVCNGPRRRRPTRLGKALRNHACMQRTATTPNTFLTNAPSLPLTNHQSCAHRRHTAPDNLHLGRTCLRQLLRIGPDTAARNRGRTMQSRGASQVQRSD